MDKLVTLAEFYDLRDELITKGEAIYHSDEFDNFVRWQHPFGTAFWRSIRLYSGLLKIRFYDEANFTDWSSTYRHGEYGFFSLGFQLSGTYGLLQEGVRDDFFAEKAGESYLYSAPGVREVESYSARSRLVRARIDIQPEFLSTFNTEQFDPLPDGLRRLLEGKTVIPFHYKIGDITPTTQVAWHQILNCPYQGMLKRMYVESKVLELVTLQFAQLITSSGNHCSTSGLRTGDIDQIHQARDILIANFDNPPSLLELARQVRLNDYKLKVGFRQVFGTTVFGYLRDYRMEQARQLLQDTQLSLANIAYAIGYDCPTSFSTAFKKRFGVNPRAYRAGIEKYED